MPPSGVEMSSWDILRWGRSSFSLSSLRVSDCWPRVKPLRGALLLVLMFVLSPSLRTPVFSAHPVKRRTHRPPAFRSGCENELPKLVRLAQWLPLLPGGTRTEAVPVLAVWLVRGNSSGEDTAGTLWGTQESGEHCWGPSFGSCTFTCPPCERFPCLACQHRGWWL